MNYCWVFHSSINNLYYYNKTTSFQTPLMYLFQSSVPHPSLWALSHFPWLWLAHAEPLTAFRLTVAVELWGSLSIPDACTHAHSEMQGNQWEVGAGGWSLSSSPRGLFWDAGSALSRGWSHEIQQTFTLRIPFSHFCSPGISFPSKVVEFKAFVPGSVFWGRQLRRALFMC